MIFGFPHNTPRFRHNMIYWHIIPSCTALTAGARCQEKDAPSSIATFFEGIGIQNQMIFASAAAELARNRHEINILE